MQSLFVRRNRSNFLLKAYSCDIVRSREKALWVRKKVNKYVNRRL